MSFTDCIAGNPTLSPAQARKLVAEYEELFDAYKATMGDDLAAAAAAKKYIDIQEKIIAKKNENIVRDVLAWERLNPKVDAVAAEYKADREQASGLFKRTFGKSEVAAAVRSLLESVYTRQQAIERRATLSIADAIEKYRSKGAGLTQDTEGFRAVVRGIFDGASNSDGKAIREVFDYLHKQYEAAGGVIGKIDNYFPQTHNTNLVARTDVNEWKATIRPLLDTNKMIDPDTGMPFTPQKLDAALNETYQSIRTNGLDELARRAEEGKQTFGRAGGVSQRRSSSRFLHFKDADAFFRYNDQFGYGDAGLFDAMMGHISTMTRDIAIMQEMGPKPESMINRLKLKAQANGAGKQAIQTINGMYDVAAGRTSNNGELPGWYLALSNIQNLLRSSLLGSAPVSAMSDSFFAAWTSKMNGVPAMKTMGQYFSLLSPTNAADRQMARRIGFIASAASGNSLRHSRFMDDANGRGMFGWLAGFTNRASGLAIMTDAIRQATVLGTQGFMAEAKSMKMKWADLDPAMREAFARWDMTEADYQNIVNSKSYVEPDSEADFIRPEDVALVNVDTAAKYEMWLVDMAQTASNEPRLLTRAIATGAIFGDATEGTFLRATASSLMMFKSFGITVLLNHMLPALRHAGTARGADRLSQLAPILFMTTLLGAASIQSRDIINGKTPREMNEKFWPAAMMQGGGFGIFGDFLFSDQSRFGSDIFKTLAGPVVGFGSDAFKVFKGNFDKALDEDQESKFLADAFQFGERYIPGVKLWYTRLILERMMLDQAERAIDPNFDNRMRRLENKNREERGQKSWWAAGETTPR